MTQPQQKAMPSSVPTGGTSAGAASQSAQTAQATQATAAAAPGASPNAPQGPTVGASQVPTQQATILAPGGTPPGGTPPGANVPPPGNPPIPGAANAATVTAAADPGHDYRGWFPRWWLLSALFCSILIGLIALMVSSTCASRSSAVLCQMAQWTDVRQEIPVGVAWLVFLIGWIIAHIFGVIYIEVDRQIRSPIAQLLRTISEFETTYTLLYIYAGIAFWLIVLMWYFNRLQTAAFIICSLVVFVGGSCFLYTRRSPADQRTWLVGASLFSVFCIAIMFLLGPVNIPLLTAEILIILIAIWNFIRRGANPTTPLNPTQNLAALRSASLTPRRIFLSLLRSLIHP